MHLLLQPLLDQVSSSMLLGIDFISYQLPIVSSVALDFEGARRGRNVSVPTASQTWGSLGACFPEENF